MYFQNSETYHWIRYWQNFRLYCDENVVDFSNGIFIRYDIIVKEFFRLIQNLNDFYVTLSGHEVTYVNIVVPPI